MEGQFARLHVDPTFVDAVDSAILKYDELLDSGCLPFEVGGRCGSMLLSEVACYMSHERVWRTIVEMKEPHALICEDDIEFCDPLIDLLCLTEKLHDGCDLLYLGYSNETPVGFLDAPFDAAESPMLQCAPYKVYQAGACGGTYCYLISASGAAKCLARSRPIQHAVDGYLISLVDNGYLVACALCPAAARHIGLDSTIDP